jgi:hypothetical protein
MNITYNQKTATPPIEFLDTPSTATNHDDILIHRTSDRTLTAIEIPNSSREIPLDAFKQTNLDLPTGSEEGILEYERKRGTIFQ